MIYAMLCKAMGSAEVYLIVRSEEKKQEVEKILGHGYKVYVTPAGSAKDLNEQLKIGDEIVRDLTRLTGGELFDDVVAACAGNDAQRLMLRLYNPNGYAVGACFGGTHALTDRADIDQNHYRAAKTIGSSGCSNRTMERIIEMLNKKELSLKGFTSKIRYSFDTPSEEFFTTVKDRLKPVLYPWG